MFVLSDLQCILFKPEETWNFELLKAQEVPLVCLCTLLWLFVFTCFSRSRAAAHSDRRTHPHYFTEHRRQHDLLGCTEQPVEWQPWIISHGFFCSFLEGTNKMHFSEWEITAFQLLWFYFIILLASFDIVTLQRAFLTDVSCCLPFCSQLSLTAHYLGLSVCFK